MTELLSERTRRTIWTALPGPQSAALETRADILFYGGAAGGGKTDLLLGCAATKHQQSIIFRRQFGQLKGLRDRSREIFVGHGKFHGSDLVWRLNDNRTIEFGAVQLVGDERKYMGRPHDLKGFDEITHFTEAQFRFLIGWNRSTDPKQRSQVICTGNPPTDAIGDWVLRFWGAWLDPRHPNPARPGELRYYITMPGKGDIEVAGPEPVRIDGEDDPVRPLSRTFIRARVQDNPYYMASGYLATLQALPEPLRSQMLKGDFGITIEDDPWQTIPTDWVIAAQARWTETGGAGRVMDTLGADISRGGGDKTVLSPRYGKWFGPQVSHAGSATPDGHAALRHIINEIPPGQRPRVQIDVIGVGSSVYDLARQQDFNAIPLHGAQKSTARDRSGTLGFANKRAEWYWRLREALDPRDGESLALPPDRELMADLTAARWKMRAEGIAIERKDEIQARIGRSPDKGDSLVYAFAEDAILGAGIFHYYREQAEALARPERNAEWVPMRVPVGRSAASDRRGNRLTINPDGTVIVPAEDAGALRLAGFIDI